MKTNDILHWARTILPAAWDWEPCDCGGIECYPNDRADVQFIVYDGRDHGPELTDAFGDYLAVQLSTGDGEGNFQYETTVQICRRDAVGARAAMRIVKALLDSYDDERLYQPEPAKFCVVDW